MPEWPNRPPPSVVETEAAFLTRRLRRASRDS